MQPQLPSAERASFVVRGTEICPTDSAHQRLQKLARITLDEMFQLVGVLDTEGTLLECNRAALEGGGVTRAEVIGKPFWEAMWWTVTPQTQAELRDAIVRAAGGELVRYDVEVYARRSGKEIMMMDFTLLPVKDETGRVVYLLPEGRDITERKARERDVAQRNVELRALLEHVRELDEKKAQLFANLSHELRAPLAQILGPAQRLMAGDETLGLAERRQAAEVISRNARMLLKHIDDLHDMSRRGAGKLELEPLSTDVAALLGRLSSHFAVLAAERSLEYTDVSPFRNIDGHLEGLFVVASDVAAEAFARTQVDPLREAAESSRLARGEVVLEKQRVALATPVASGIELASLQLERGAHTLEVDVPRSGLDIDADPARIAQVVANLLANAATYTPSGGHISVRAAREGCDVLLRVRDTGISLSPEALRRIFELFVEQHQADDRSQQPLRGGSRGIGLAIVRNLVELHGGSVTARSEGLGRGSEFTVRLPLAASSRAEDGAVTRPGAPEGAAPGARAARLLIVDDNEDAAEMLSFVLGTKGYETRVAHDGPTALQVAAEFEPDIALLDIGLPVMDGYELAARLRQLPRLGAVRLVAVTGYGQESDRRRTGQAGFHRHLVKPVRLDALEEVVTSLAPGA